jgi:rRNA-processing protein FCF1
MKVLLDTNFLMVPHQFGVDIFEFLKDYTLVVLSPCVKELETLSKKKSEDGIAAKIALQLIEKKKVEIVKAEENADNAIVEYAKKHNIAVATNDKELMKALKTSGIRIIRLRQNKYLVEE